MRKKILFFAEIFLLICTAVFCLVKTEKVSNAVAEALRRCIYVIIPSLYAMMIVPSLLIKSGIIDRISLITGSTGKIIFGMEKVVFSVFCFSMIAGYPVGTKMLSSAYEKGLIEKHRAEIFSGLCFGAGSAFIYGCIAGQLYGNRSAGNIIFISTLSANILLAFVVSFFMRKNCNSHIEKSAVTLSPQMLTECVISGGHSIMNICFMVIAFAVVTEILKYSGIISVAGNLLSQITDLSADDSGQFITAIFDVTAVNGFSVGNYKLLPYLSFLVSFGGICVIFQISAISGKLSLKPLIFLRIISAVISFIICRIITPFMLSGETVPTSVINVRTHQAHSPIPSVMLVIMTFFLFCEYEKIKPLRLE
ncbi:MAG: hypothetical protein K2K02_02890 [Ruminococcus sp.]|nr:hypothetical protein [Ruminococcus sp.]